jgi:hypothetical protein
MFPYSRQTLEVIFLSAHLLSYQLYLKKDSNYLDVTEGDRLDSNWPCDGSLLRLAVDVAKKILPGKLELFFLN